MLNVMILVKLLVRIKILVNSLGVNIELFNLIFNLKDVFVGVLKNSRLRFIVFKGFCIKD